MMTSHGNGPPSQRDGLINGTANKRRNSDDPPSFASHYIPNLSADAGASYSQPSRSDSSWGSVWHQGSQMAWSYSRDLASRARRLKPRDFLDVRLTLILIWVIAIWWGEESTFDSKVGSCAWDRWEQWPHDSNPHHLVLIADPQLVDPHTYPGRPWPLSTLTIRYTDLYMRKSFQKIRDALIPDSVLFLGDLFDGGREWSNDPSTARLKEQNESVDREWRRYRNDYWMKEYRRFGGIFFDTWLKNKDTLRAGQRGRRFIADVPGNHDLGLGGGIRLPARKRFNAYFGDGNRVDVIGNHTFVSLDTVSLSAKGQQAVGTGTQGIRDDDQTKAIWEPAEQFLHEVNARKSRAIDRELRVQDGKPEHEPMDQTFLELDDPRAHTLEQQPKVDSDIPSVILTHVPLYRAEGTPCGPLREKYPPSHPPQSGEYTEKDDRNSIHVQAGKQYQNVLTPAISNEIIDLVSNVSHVFSGDDHDYCELVHREYTSKGGGVREITVKSTSWAMGVRHPGFLLVSLWNPIDNKGKALSPDLTKKGTIQTHLCLLPDQLTIFIRYGLLFVITLFIITARAILLERSTHSIPRKSDPSTQHLLPVTRSRNDSSSSSMSKDLAPSSAVHSRTNTITHSSSSSASTTEQHQQQQYHQNGSLNVRSAAGASRPRSISPGRGYGIPVEEAPSWMKVDRGGSGWNEVDPGVSTGRRKGGRGVSAVVTEIGRSVRLVGGVVLGWYFYLLWMS